MAFENVLFLLSRYTSGLEEVEKDHNHVPLYNSFQNIRQMLEKKVNSSMSDTAMAVVKECLNNLNEALANWQVLSQNHIGSPLLYSPKQLYFICETKLLLSTITQKLNNINNDSPSSSFIVSVIEQRRTSEMCDPSKIFGFDDQMKKIVELLERQNNDCFSAVGIAGMGGTGKTTLAQLLFSNESVQKEFMPRIWVPMSRTLIEGEDLKMNVVKYLLQELGDDEFESTDDIGIEKLLLILHRQLSGKSYLIVFDDIWRIDDWYDQLGSKLLNEDQRGERLAYGLPKGYGGGVIVTSRLEKIVERMVAKDSLHMMVSLQDSDSWSIFMTTIEEEKKVSSIDPVLLDMKDEILKKCNGLPLAAKTLGKVLSDLIFAENQV